MKIIILSLILMLFTACATTVKFPPNNLNQAKMKSVKIGDSWQVLRKKLGPPSQIQNIENENTLAYVYPKDETRENMFYCNNMYYVLKKNSDQSEYRVAPFDHRYIFQSNPTPQDRCNSWANIQTQYNQQAAQAFTNGLKAAESSYRATQTSQEPPERKITCDSRKTFNGSTTECRETPTY